jgi:hypothetical protein
MTVVPPKVVPPKLAPNKAAPVVGAKKSPVLEQKKIVKKKYSFLSGDPVNVDFVTDEVAEYARHKRAHKMLSWQTITIAFLTVFMVIIQPLMKPIYHYYARNPAGEELQLNGLVMPNITSKALLAWASTSVTEIMTFGFGDVVDQLGKQKHRFTTSGWESFVTAFRRQRINETFKENQLVLTTVPSDTAVIIAQGLNEEGEYQWRVQVPVVMTYATNNNVSQVHHSVITLTIVRVSPLTFPSGIAIRKWVISG